MKTDQASARAPEGMAGLAKGLQILEAIADARQAVSVSRAAELTGISRASARRCLLTLAEQGYLSRDGSLYRPTPRLLRLSAAYFEAASLPTLAQPHLEAARNLLNESVSLAVLQGDAAVMVARAQVFRPVATYAQLGSSLPAYASATGRVLLAALPDAEIRRILTANDLVAHSPRTETDPTELFRIVTAVRAEQIAFSVEQFELGIFALAVPVVDRSGATVAAVSISASMARIAPDHALTEFRPVLEKCAQAISRLL